jgi:RNA polymerase sigma-70 factor (ECF subfamily)
MLVTMNDRPASAVPPEQDFLAEPAIGRAASQHAIDDERLVARFREGNQTAFDRLVEHHQERIARLVQRLLGYRAEVEDVVQDVFVDVLRGITSFDGRSSFTTWITRIAVNRCRSYQRKHWLRRLLPLSLEEGRVERNRDAAATQETIEQVQKAIRQLSQRDRELIVLRYLEEMPTEEIARMFNQNRNAIDVRLSRARKRLEQLLKPFVEE